MTFDQLAEELNTSESELREKLTAKVVVNRKQPSKFAFGIKLAKGQNDWSVDAVRDYLAKQSREE